MTENKEYKNVPQYQQEDEMEIDLMEYARKLWAARKLLFKVGGMAAIVGVIIALSMPKQYTAEVKLSPESSKGGGNLSGMAAMLGIGSVNMGGDANALNFSMASDIMASTPFVLELFNTKVRTLNGKVDTTLVAYLDSEKRPWWSSLLSFPSKAIGGVMSLFSSKEETVGEKPINPFQLTSKQMNQVNAIKRIFMASSDKKTGITKISATLQDPLVAATLVDTVLVKLQKYITNYKTSKAQEDCKYWEELYQQRQKEYYEAQERYARYSDANQNVILQSVRIEQERLQNEQSLAFQVFSQVATQLQMSKAKLQEEKPAFAILEPASVPLQPTGTSRKMILVSTVFLFVAAAAAWVLFGVDLWKKVKEGLAENKEEKEA